MRIGIDATLLERRITGGSRYLESILKWIPQTDKKNEYFLFCLEELEKYSRDFKIVSTGKPKFIPLKIYLRIWFYFLLPRYLKKYNIDVFFSSYFFLPLVSFNAKKVVTIHDLAHKVDKNYKDFLYRNYLNLFLPISIKKSDVIISISEATKKDIVKFYGRAVVDEMKEKIKVIYSAADDRFKSRMIIGEDADKKMAMIRQKYHLPKKFVLYLGRIENRKNVKGIIEIARMYKEKIKMKDSILQDLKFALIGETGYTGSQKLMERIEKAENISHIEYVEDKDLPYIYNLANLFLFPSFYEGFGLPVLEAMQSGIPVLASNTSSLPEIVGDGGIVHNPDDYQGFVKDIMRFMEDKDFYEEMKHRAINQAKKFNWKSSTEKLVKIFNDL